MSLGRGDNHSYMKFLPIVDRAAGHDSEMKARGVSRRSLLHDERRDHAEHSVLGGVAGQAIADVV